MSTTPRNKKINFIIHGRPAVKNGNSKMVIMVENSMIISIILCFNVQFARLFCNPMVPPWVGKTKKAVADSAAKKMMTPPVGLCKIYGKATACIIHFGA